jgi:NAD-dependent dihydropyrimidine dehydrogenase PreA subunit
MIDLTDKAQCCGCGACVTVCPARCIGFSVDSEGFAYPVVDRAGCTQCGLCVKVCPFLNPFEPVVHPTAYAVKHRDSAVRQASSSGGAFTALAEATIRNGGVVFGARWDRDWAVEHAYTDTVDGLSAFRGSKYLQSHIGDAYKRAEEFLMMGREVLFSGTPCQIAGLKRFLRGDYPKLLAVDFVCHGVPSPKVFQTWLREVCRAHCPEGADIRQIDFRNKKDPYNWRNAGFAVRWTHGGEDGCFSESSFQNGYGKGFLSHIYLRPSSHRCAVKRMGSGSDVTMGDFWGIEQFLPAFDDGNGISLVFTNTARGSRILDALAEVIDRESVVYVERKTFCPMLTDSVRPHRNRERFFQRFAAGQHSVGELVVSLARPSFYRRGRNLTSRLLRKTGLRGFVRQMESYFR